MPNSFRKQKGVVLVTFAVSALVLILFFGLTVDVGFWYMSRAALSKGTDAAALMGVRSLGEGEDAARAAALNTFEMNYAASGLPARQAADPSVTVTFNRDENNNLRVNVQSSARIRSYFLSVLPDWSVLNVKARAETSRAKLIMTIVLDRSGSMINNGGAAALPGAVGTFIDFFDDANDEVAMSSYAGHARLDVPIGNNFKSDIDREVRAMRFGGWTFAHGGIDIGRDQIDSVELNVNENVHRALVFFTDGQANSMLKNTNCRRGDTRDLVLVPGDDDDDFRDPEDGDRVSCDERRTRNFFSEKYQAERRRNSSNVSEEGEFMAELRAGEARANGIFVYSIGLGNNLNRASLERMANIPGNPSYDPTEPEGFAAFAPTAAELDDVFRQIAARILLRLTR